MNNCKKCGHEKFVYRESGKHIGEYCANCEAWQKWIPQNNPIKIMPFGKYKGDLISEINDYQYLGWLEQSLSAKEENMLYSPNPMDHNWGGAEFTQSLIDQGYYKDNEVLINVP
jgi:hypothetical protein